MAFMFWLCAGLLLYVYVGYPLLLLMVGLRKNATMRSDSPLPSVTLIISAYNESAVISEKLLNSLRLDYPPQLLEIMVVSDASDDGTDDIVKTFAPSGVRLVTQEKRLGKTAGLNAAIPSTSGNILVFSDANAMFDAQAVRHLVRSFSTPQIGYVVGNARYTQTSDQPASATSEGLYWRFESWMKARESTFGSVVGGDGAIYAIRKYLYTPLRETDINDLVNPLQIIVSGYRGIYEPAAVCYEQAGGTFEKEFRRKVRIVGRSLAAVLRVWPVLLPWTQPRHWLCLISHKVLRWFAPILLIIMLILSLALRALEPYRLFAVLQIAFYILAFLGWALSLRGISPKLISLPYYFCLVNVACLYGLFNLISGNLSPTWNTVRHERESISLPRKGNFEL
jgi:cellulose synthase/poly-beta-1,6-N-acetylglucosamine synthase-like glycosyltransferase